MRNDREYERRISFRNLFFHLLYRWRSILAAALIGAVLLGGYAYISNRNRAGGNKPAPAAETEAAGETGFLQDNYEASNRLFQNLLENIRNYRNSSIVMKIDPYQVWKATTQYAVIMDGTGNGETGTYNPSVPIAAAYPSLVFDDPDLGELREIYGEAELRYINEVVSAASVANSGSFSVTVIGLTEEMATEGQAYFDERIMKASRGDIQQMGSHHLVRLSRIVRQTVDTDIETRQAAIAKNIYVYQDSITDNETSISKAPSAVRTSGKAAKKPGLKYAVAGGVCGALILLCLYAVLYLLSGKLRNSRELTERFGVPVFGELNHFRGRRPGKGVDGLIGKWEFRKAGADREAVLENVCALIRERDVGGSVLLTGTLSAGRIQGIADELAKRLGDAVQIRVEGGFLNNGKAVTEAGEASAVIIAEEQHVSETEDVRRMLEALSLGKTPVIGAVVF